MAWDAIVTSVRRLSQGPYSQAWHCSSTLRVLIKGTHWQLGVHGEMKNMKRVVICMMIVLMAVCAIAQTPEVTQFLGIPVDGTKSEMIQKLKAKGFRPNQYDNDVLEGEFNGTKVNVHVVTTGNKVSRIMVTDANTMNETDIKIRFNRLCGQFENNKKYISFYDDQRIPNDEKIPYEMRINNKRYQGVFYQIPKFITDQRMSESDSIWLFQQIRPILMEKHTEEEWKNPTEEMQKECEDIFRNFTYDYIRKRPVWFMISENMGKYDITMYYDNEFNRANGEDL